MEVGCETVRDDRRFARAHYGLCVASSQRCCDGPRIEIIERVVPGLTELPR
jgi:hypothetical protein